MFALENHWDLCPLYDLLGLAGRETGCISRQDEQPVIRLEEASPCRGAVAGCPESRARQGGRTSDRPDPGLNFLALIARLTQQHDLQGLAPEGHFCWPGLSELSAREGC